MTYALRAGPVHDGGLWLVSFDARLCPTVEGCRRPTMGERGHAGGTPSRGPLRPELRALAAAVLVTLVRTHLDTPKRVRQCRRCCISLLYLRPLPCHGGPGSEDDWLRALIGRGDVHGRCHLNSAQEPLSLPLTYRMAAEAPSSILSSESAKPSVDQASTGRSQGR